MNYRSLFRLLAVAVVFHGAIAFSQIEVNSGGPIMAPFAEDSGFTWEVPFADLVPVVGAVQAPEEFYHTERYGNFSYTLVGLLANTTCEVRLHFAEINTGVTLKGI